MFRNFIRDWLFARLSTIWGPAYRAPFACWDRLSWWSAQWLIESSINHFHFQPYWNLRKSIEQGPRKLAGSTDSYRYRFKFCVVCRRTSSITVVQSFESSRIVIQSLKGVPRAQRHWLNDCSEQTDLRRVVNLSVFSIIIKQSERTARYIRLTQSNHLHYFMNSLCIVIRLFKTILSMNLKFWN